jgi:hypothetical protein
MFSLVLEGFSRICFDLYMHILVICQTKTPLFPKTLKHFENELFNLGDIIKVYTRRCLWQSGTIVPIRTPVVNNSILLHRCKNSYTLQHTINTCQSVA